MKVAVVSYDLVLHNLCNACLVGVGAPAQAELIHSYPTSPTPSADLYIWDFLPEGGSAPWLGIATSDRHLIVSEPRALAELAPFVAGMTLIVKPVTEQALAGWMNRFLGNNQVSDFVQKEEEQERQWSDFLAKAVHDFRAPLTAASGYCGLLLGDELGALTDQQ